MRHCGTLVVDFDDTLVRTACRIIVHKANGTRVLLSSTEFTKYVHETGDQLDFSEFSFLRRPQPIHENIRLVRKFLARGWDGYVCTAREDRAPVAKFLRMIGLDLGIVASCMRPQLKRTVVEYLLEEGQQVVFMDDSHSNVKAVRELERKYPQLRTVQV